MFGAWWTLHPHLPKWIRQVHVITELFIYICSWLFDLTHPSPSVQVDSDCAVGGAGRGVQHLMHQVGLQCYHCVPHQTVLRRQEAQDHSWDIVRKKCCPVQFKSQFLLIIIWTTDPLNMPPIFFYFFCSAPNDKKSFCSIEGEWNGVMYAKWATGVSSLFPGLIDNCFSLLKNISQIKCRHLLNYSSLFAIDK